MKLSIVVKIYNKSKFLSKCLESLVCQSLSDTEYEVICVNDCSTDNSSEIAHKFADKYEFIKVIDKPKNEGRELANLTGIKASKGDYIGFVDSDDWVGKNIFSEMLEKAYQYDADYVDVRFRRVIGHHFKISKEVYTPVGLIETPQLFDNYYISYFGVNLLWVGLNGKIYKRALIDKVLSKLPYNVSVCEDMMFNLDIFPYLKRIFIINKIGYNYRWGGITSSFNPTFYEDYKKFYFARLKKIQELNYFKALKPLKIEMKNLIRSNIYQMIDYNVCSKNNIINWISHEIEQPFWDEAIKIETAPHYYNEPFVKRLISKDAEGMYEICLNDIRRRRYKKKIKRFVLSFLNNI